MSALRSLLDRDKDDDTPNLNVLLCETYTAVYLSLLVYGLATCDCHILYRLVTQKPNTTVWAQIFGGGTKKVIFSSPFLFLFVHIGSESEVTQFMCRRLHTCTTFARY